MFYLPSAVANGAVQFFDDFILLTDNIDLKYSFLEGVAIS